MLDQVPEPNKGHIPGKCPRACSEQLRVQQGGQGPRADPFCILSSPLLQTSFMIWIFFYSSAWCHLSEPSALRDCHQHCCAQSENPRVAEVGALWGCLAQPPSPQHSRSEVMMLPGASQVLNMSMSKAPPSSLVPDFVTITGEKYSIRTNCVAGHSCHLWSCCTPVSWGETEQPPGALPCWAQLLLTPWSCSSPQPVSCALLGGQWLLGHSGAAGSSQEPLPCRAGGSGPREVQRSVRAAGEVGEGRGFGTALTDIHSLTETPSMSETRP